MKMRGIWALLVLLNLGLLANCAEPNYEDFESALEQPQGETVEVHSVYFIRSKVIINQ